MAIGTVCLKEALRDRLKDVECELATVKCLHLAERKLREMPEGGWSLKPMSYRFVSRKQLQP